MKNIQKHIWIGTWSLGGERYGACPESEAIATLKQAYTNGYRHFDTAGFYARGQSEVRLEKALGAVRSDLYISSKGGLLWDGNTVRFDGRPAALKTALTETLTRLKTDCIDLFSLHWPDPKTPIQLSIEALEQFKEEGLIKDWGVGNLSPTDLKNLPSRKTPIPHQVHYNPIIDTMAPSLQTGNKTCLNIITSPFEHGLLLDPEKKLGKKDHRRKSLLYSDHKTQEKCRAYFLNKTSPEARAEAVLTDLLNNPLCHRILIGPRHPQQLEMLHRIITSIHAE